MEGEAVPLHLFLSSLTHDYEYIPERDKLMITSIAVAGPTGYAAQLKRAGEALGRSMDAYHACSAEDESPEQARAMVAGFAEMFRAMLPGASGEMLEALTSLCAVECARQRLEHQADHGTLPGARVLSVPGAGQ